MTSNQLRNFYTSLTEDMSENNKREIRQIQTELYLNLNPNDDEDEKILQCIARILNPHNRGKLEELINELRIRSAHLLKHDWERVKREASIIDVRPYHILSFTFITWIILKFLYFDTNIIQSLHKIPYFQGVFTKTCWIIILLCIGYYGVKGLDKWLSRYKHYCLAKKFLGCLVRSR